MTARKTAYDKVFQIARAAGWDTHSDGTSPRGWDKRRSVRFTRQPGEWIWVQFTEGGTVQGIRHPWVGGVVKYTAADPGKFDVVLDYLTKALPDPAFQVVAERTVTV